MTHLLLFIGFLLSVTTTAAFIPVLQRVASERGWVDVPDEPRKRHAGPVPAVGGVGIASGFFVGLIYLYLIDEFVSFPMPFPPVMWWIGAALMVAVGFYDDVRDLNFKQKFFYQLVAAYLLLLAGYRFDVSGFAIIGEDPYDQALYSIPLTLVWIVGVINAVNLLDGMDGLAAGVVMIGFICLGSIFGLHGQPSLVMMALLMCGPLIGFLMYNFNPASIFMGDSGSLFLGFTLAAFSLEGQVHADPALAVLIPAVALGLPVLDTNLSMVRRFLSGRAICGPDHDHIHHRLAARWSHRQTVLVLYAVAAGFGAMAILMATVSTGPALVLFGATLVAAVAGVLRLAPARIGAPARDPGFRKLPAPDAAAPVPAPSEAGSEQPGFVLAETDDELVLSTTQGQM